ncbi:MAG TPA: lytic transglycosylase domain-containing protein [Candidatus Acidoferrales bacterium]|nr:lytic transglycosylase domain-containing protein [Candidatus Acidoferrales bacterium]
MKLRALIIVTLLLLCRLAPAQTNDANTVTIDVNGLMDAAQSWAQANLDDDVLQALQGVDRTQVEDFLKHYQDYLKGDYVLDLAQLNTAVTTVLPLLEAHEETQPYAAWLRSRMDYFEAAQEMQAAAAAPVTGTGTNAPPPKVVTNIVSTVRGANPSFKAEQEIWVKKVAPRPWPKAAAELVPELKPIFVSEKVPAELVWLAEVESGFDAGAESPAGALGMFQLMPATAKEYGLSLWPFDERKQAEPAAHAAAKLLHKLHAQFGDWRLAVAAYNCGEGRVAKTLARYGAKSYEGIATHLPAETQMYVPKVEATVALREGVNLEKLKVPDAL